MLIFFRVGWARRKNAGLSGTRQLTVSVVIPFRDEEAYLPNLLEDLTNQSYPKNLFEVILVNDHSLDESVSVVHDFSSDIDLQLLNSKQEGKKKALELGIRSAQNEVILQTDADCRLPENWIVGLVNAFDQQTGLVTAVVKMNPSEGFWSQFAALEFLSLQASGLALTNLGRPIMASAANLAYRKQLWEEVVPAGDSHESGDDVFLVQAVAKAAWKVKGIYHPAVGVMTNAPRTFKEMIHQRARWGGKTPSYQSFLAKAIALLVAAYSLWCVVLLVMGFASQPILQLFVFMMGAKALWDYFFLKSYSRSTGQQKLMKMFATAALVYPFYIVITLVVMLFPQKWKGRTIR